MAEQQKATKWLQQFLAIKGGSFTHIGTAFQDVQNLNIVIQLLTDEKDANYETINDALEAILNHKLMPKWDRLQETDINQSNMQKIVQFVNRLAGQYTIDQVKKDNANAKPSAKPAQKLPSPKSSAAAAPAPAHKPEPEKTSSVETTHLAKPPSPTSNSKPSPAAQSKPAEEDATISRSDFVSRLMMNKHRSNTIAPKRAAESILAAQAAIAGKPITPKAADTDSRPISRGSPREISPKSSDSDKPNSFKARLAFAQNNLAHQNALNPSAKISCNPPGHRNTSPTKPQPTFAEEPPKEEEKPVTRPALRPVPKEEPKKEVEEEKPVIKPALRPVPKEEPKKKVKPEKPISKPALKPVPKEEPKPEPKPVPKPEPKKEEPKKEEEEKPISRPPLRPVPKKEEEEKPVIKPALKPVPKEEPKPEPKKEEEKPKPAFKPEPKKEEKPRASFNLPKKEEEEKKETPEPTKEEEENKEAPKPTENEVLPPPKPVLTTDEVCVNSDMLNFPTAFRRTRRNTVFVKRPSLKDVSPKEPERPKPAESPVMRPAAMAGIPDQFSSPVAGGGGRARRPPMPGMGPGMPMPGLGAGMPKLRKVNQPGVPVYTKNEAGTPRPGKEEKKKEEKKEKKEKDPKLNEVPKPSGGGFFKKLFGKDKGKEEKTKEKSPKSSGNDINGWLSLMGVEVSNIATDFKDGTNLIKLIKSMTGDEIEVKPVKPALLKFQNPNLDEAIKYFDSKNLTAGKNHISKDDFMNGNENNIKNFLAGLMSKYPKPKK